MEKRPKVRKRAIGGKVQYTGTTDHIPPIERNNKWQREFEKHWSVNPGVAYQYEGTGKYTVTHLRREYGVNAVRRRGTLYVVYDPEKVEEIKRESFEMGKKISKSLGNMGKTIGEVYE